MIPDIDWASLDPQRLAISILDDEAKASPDRPYAVLPVSATSFEDGTRTLSYAQLANAVNGIAQWLTEHLGYGIDFETLTYFGVNDFMHVPFALGAVKSGYKLFLTPPREPPHLQARMLQDAGCNKIFVSEDNPLVSQILEHLPGSKIITIPRIDDFLTQKFEIYPYNKTWEEAKHEPIVSMSTSGTTGAPKPIVWTNEYFSGFATQRYLEPPAGYEVTDTYMMGTRLYNLGPPYHASGMWTAIALPLFCKTVVMLPPAKALPDAKLAVDGIIATKADAVIFLPPFMEQLARNPALLERLVKESPDTVIFWGGGGVSQEAGDIISQRIHLVDMCGSTETGIWPGLRKSGPWNPQTWSSLHPHPGSGLQLRHVADDIHSAVFVKNSSVIQPVFCVDQTAQEVPTGDLWKATKIDEEQRWISIGREDDLQTFLGADKLDTTDLERSIIKACHNSELDQVLVACNGLPFAVVLFETKNNAAGKTESEQDHAGFLSEFWPKIETLNESLPNYAILDRSRVVFTKPEQPMLRTSKGTIRRKLTMAAYRQEFDDVIKATGWTPKDYLEV